MQTNQFQTLYFRGHIQSCNYTCRYCPFAKNKFCPQELERDQHLLAQFHAFVAKQQQPVRIMLLPYGEALIHRSYQEAYCSLAQLPNVVGISCQTNLSFTVEDFVNLATSKQIPLSKLKLWASYHPEMIPMERFLNKVHRLFQQGVELCVGAVGDPDNLPRLIELRKQLDPRIYLFINAMQGLKRPLTDDESNAFARIDNLFHYDLTNAKADFEVCRGRHNSVFVNKRGQLSACPRNTQFSGTLQSSTIIPECHRAICDCYIAYSNLHNTPLSHMMGSGHLWRIPERKRIQAIFLDIDGTLTEKNGVIPERYANSLTILAKTIPLYLITALPYQHAQKRLKQLMPLFKGGVFAEGAHLKTHSIEQYLPCPAIARPNLPLKRFTAYSDLNQQIYKYAIVCQHKSDTQLLAQQLHMTHRVTHEHNLLTLVNKNASKVAGLHTLLDLEGFDRHKILTVGNSLHDLPMLRYSGYSCAVLTARKALKQAAAYVLNPDSLPLFFKGESED